MERTTNVSVTPLFIELLGDAYGDWICLDYRMQQRVERLDAIQVAPHQVVRWSTDPKPLRPEARGLSPQQIGNPPQLKQIA